MLMSIIGELLIVVAILTATGVSAFSIIGLRYASRQPANGEVKQLREFDETVVHFHKVVKQLQKADMRAYHTKRGAKLLT